MIRFDVFRMQEMDGVKWIIKGISMQIIFILLV